MAEKRHILDDILDAIREGLDENVKIYLARDEETNEVLAVTTEEFQRGLPIDQIIHSYAVYRIYQTESEEEAIQALAKSLQESINGMLTESVEEKPTEK
tara:strand:- start:700 stop:996 length:297 start_codon:yes stop_codon:yes gene_type:complete